MLRTRRQDCLQLLRLLYDSKIQALVFRLSNILVRCPDLLEDLVEVAQALHLSGSFRVVGHGQFQLVPLRAWL